MNDPSARLDRVRTDPRTHAVGLGVTLTVGLLLTSIHWLGLIVAGVLVALVAPTFRRGVAYAALAGVLALTVFAVLLGLTVMTVLGIQPIIYVTVASAVGLPMFGSLAHGVV